MSERSYDGPPIDATEQHISERPEIEYATDPEPQGTMTTTINLPDHVEPSNESRRKVLEAAADPARSWESFEDLQREVTPEKAHSYAAQVLREDWPAKHEEIKSGDKKCDGWNLTPSILYNIRLRNLQGETASEIAESYPRHPKSVERYIRGDLYKQVSEKCDIPPLEQGELPDGWVFKNGEVRKVDAGSDEEGVFEQLEIEIDEEAAEEPVDNTRKSLSEELAEATETTVEEIEAGAESIEIDDPASNDGSGVRWGVAVLVAGVAAVVWWVMGGRR